MVIMSEWRKKIRIGVIGGSNPDDRAILMAFRVGQAIGEAGAILVCGGLGGVMEAAASGAKKAGGLPFRAIVALYPYCPKVAPPLANDLLILIGDADDWASAARCSVYVDKYQTGTAHRPYLRVYPGARHSFDAKRPERVYFGHRLAYDPKATADAIERTRKFLNDHLGAK